MVPIVNYTFRIFSLILFSTFLACSPVKIMAPNEADLLSANYGNPPPVSALPELIKKYLKRKGYKDPNSAEIEDCSAPQKGWMHAGEKWESIFEYGWQFECDINAKNSMGGYVGFSREKYVYRDGEIKAGNIPIYEVTPVQGNPFFTPPRDSNQVIWK